MWAEQRWPAEVELLSSVTAMKARFGMYLALIALVGFAGRAGYILVETRHQQLGVMASSGQPQPAVRRTLDEYYYANGAVNITHGDAFKERIPGYPAGTDVALHPPLTEVVLAPVAWVAGGSQLAMRFALALSGTAVVVVIGLIGREAAGPRAGLIAAALAAVYPNLWMHDGLIMSESLSALTTAGAVLCIYRLVRRPSSRMAAATGVVCGLAALTRSELVVLAPLVAAPAVWFGSRGLPRSRRVVAIAVLEAAALATVAPWIVYNMSRFEDPVLISYGEGSTLEGANCNRTYSGPNMGFWDGLCAKVDPSHEPSVEAAAQRREAFRYVGHHAGRLPAVVAARVGRVLGLYRPMDMLRDYQREGKPLWASIPGWVMSLTFVPFAIYGVVALRGRITLIPLLGIVVVVVLVAAAFYGNFRNRVPGDVVLAVLAAAGIDAVVRRVSAVRSTG